MLCLDLTLIMIRQQVLSLPSLERGKTYVVTTPDVASDDIDTVIAAQSDLDAIGDFTAGVFFTMDEDVDIPAGVDLSNSALGSGQTYEIVTVPAEDADKTAIINNSNLTSEDQLVVGMAFTMTSDLAATGVMVINGRRECDHERSESVQRKINTARVQAGSQYAALESAVTYTTDLTAQYELAYIRFMM